LDNGENLSIVFLQDAKTNKTVQAGLTRHQPDGKTKFCKEVTFVPQRSWKSAQRRTYSVAWEIKAPALGLTVQTRTLTDDHEIPVLLYERIWEGPCRAEVSYQDGRKVKGSGFQEMIGQGQ
jgi:predicted secreted hydrolase